MILSVPILALFGVLLVVFLRKDGLKFWHAIVAMLLGFQLSSTAFAGQITSALTAADHLLSSIL